MMTLFGVTILSPFYVVTQEETTNGVSVRVLPEGSNHLLRYFSH